MKNYFIELFNEQNRKTTIVLLIYSIVSIASGLIKSGDGEILAYFGIIILMIMFVRHWRSATKFFIFFISSIIGFKVFSILHMVMERIHETVGDIIVLSQLLVFLKVSSFLILIFVCPPGVLVGAVGTIVYLLSRKIPPISRFVTMKKKIFITLINIFIPVAIITLLITLPSAEHDVVKNGISFETFREISGGYEGTMTEDTVIDGWPCKRDSVSFYPDWRLDHLDLFRDYERNGVFMPAGTWVIVNEEGNPGSCMFPYDVEIQGHLCRGNDFMTEFYPSGKLKGFYSRGSVVIDGVTCKGGIIDFIQLHENGRLKQCIE